MQWETDWGLRARMGLTMFLLFALYLVFVGVLTLYFEGLLVPAILLGGFSIAQFFFSDKLALRSMGARTVDQEEYPELHAKVGRLAQQADLPKPTVAVADNQTPNAFATGRSPSNSAVCVTTGLLQTLDDEELEGVLAHELAHIKNRDVAVMTIASFLSTIAFLIVRWGWLFSGGRGGRNQAPLIVAILVSLLVWVLSFLLIRALSRYREYSADRGAAAITGKPSALATALMKISGRMDEVPQEDLREQAEMNAFFIIPISKGFIAKLASTHPPTETRIEKLRELEREMER
ncbi:HtpX-like protease [Natronomonas pharaonis DSM 2160]|uniref:Protease HtpX homolog n=1 Tax=Natronomonas pharaonis (strain ATCC 35678 / DSM 2160 / CIP 103997 / JCM 8858 / NBRC 14720 / NCIMB 2260 / Gabara) TaxID=348780 RepID=A0A1U7EUD1_NATPD|nr:zinc metalloprotease HtpX [Natronomonas pharaonis]CAI48573.1 HtpX-like protease [Natronomonas pharaonis DSM 2160]